MPESEPSAEYDTPPPGFYTDAKEKPPSKEPNLDQNLPLKELLEDSYYHLSPSKYPHYQSSIENPSHDSPQDYIYVDHDPNLHEHKPDINDHIPYYHPYYQPPTFNSTYQPPEASDSYLPKPITYGPEENRNRKPYTYYYLGRKLWYIPLYFSVYFIVYITSLLVKSIARHKIKYPISYWAGYSRRALGNWFNKRDLELATEQITTALSTTERRYA
jgi:hypothetical protein